MDDVSPQPFQSSQLSPWTLCRRNRPSLCPVQSPPHRTCNSKAVIVYYEVGDVCNWHPSQFQTNCYNCVKEVPQRGQHKQILNKYLFRACWNGRGNPLCWVGEEESGESSDSPEAGVRQGTCLILEGVNKAGSRKGGFWQEAGKRENGRKVWCQSAE